MDGKKLGREDLEVFINQFYAIRVNIRDITAKVYVLLHRDSQRLQDGISENRPDTSEILQKY